MGTHLGNGELKIINLDYKNPVVSGKLDKSNSLQQLNGLKNSIELCLNKKFDALITLPIHKKILSSKKNRFTGHTEYIADACGLKGVTVKTMEETTKAIKQSCEDQKKGITTFIEVILNQELGEPFRRDAMKKPVKVAGIKKEDMVKQPSLI